jgi:hypothetical protein
MKKLIPLLIIIILAFGAVSATGFPAPAGSPPTGNIVPLHTGTSQVKNGSLSVNTLVASGIAVFKQQIYINNTNLGETTDGQKGHLKGSYSDQNNASIVVFGGSFDENNTPTTIDDDILYNTSLIGTDTVTAKQFLQSGRVAHGIENTKRDLCADTAGQVVYCDEIVDVIDICANIQGTQTNPPTGMIQDGVNCVWGTVLPPPPALAIDNVSCYMRPVLGGTRDDHVECAVNLNAPNNTGNDAQLSVNYTYRDYRVGNSSDRSGSLVVLIPNGQASAISDIFPINPDVTIIDSCIDGNTVPTGISISTALAC